MPALAAQLRAFSSLLSLPSQAQSVIKAFCRQGIGSADEFNTARFLLSRLESLFVTQKAFQIFRGRAGRDSVICSVPLSLHSTNPTDSPDSRFCVIALVVLSVCLCQWRKDPYLPYQPLSVRHLPRTNVLACSMFVPALRHCFAAPKVSPDHPSGERNSRFCFSASLGFISRPKVCDWFISMAKGCILRLSPPDAFIVQVMFRNLLYDICLLCSMDVLKTCNRLARSL